MQTASKTCTNAANPCVKRFMVEDIENCSDKAMIAHPPNFVFLIVAEVSSDCVIIASYQANLVCAKLWADHCSHTTRNLLGTI